MEFKERQHLQEWIAKYPSCLGEDLLVIQFEREDWPRMIEFMTDATVRMEMAFHDPLQKLNADVRSRTFELEDGGDGL